MGLSKAEQKMFSSEKIYNYVLRRHIELKQEFSFLEMGSKRFQYRELREPEINYCLDMYNSLIKIGIEPTKAKRTSLRKSIDYIYCMNPNSVLKDLRDRKAYGDDYYNDD